MSYNVYPRLQGMGLQSITLDVHGYLPLTRNPSSAELKNKHMKNEDPIWKDKHLYVSPCVDNLLFFQVSNAYQKISTYRKVKIAEGKIRTFFLCY